MKAKILLILTALSVLSACVTAPKGLEREQYRITAFKKIESDDYQCRCQTIRLAGKVMSATALQNRTKIEVFSLPVSRFNGQPILDAQSDGRFIAYFNGFIDPETLKDRYITVGGVLKNTEKGKIDDATYTYPVIQIERYRIWQLGQDYYYPYDEDFAPWRPWGFGGWRHHWYDEPQVRYYLY